MATAKLLNLHAFNASTLQEKLLDGLITSRRARPEIGIHYTPAGGVSLSNVQERMFTSSDQFMGFVDKARGNVNRWIAKAKTGHPSSTHTVFIITILTKVGSMGRALPLA